MISVPFCHTFNAFPVVLLIFQSFLRYFWDFCDFSVIFCNFEEGVQKISDLPLMIEQKGVTVDIERKKFSV